MLNNNIMIQDKGKPFERPVNSDNRKSQSQPNTSFYHEDVNKQLKTLKAGGQHLVTTLSAEAKARQSSYVCMRCKACFGCFGSSGGYVLRRSCCEQAATNNKTVMTCKRGPLVKFNVFKFGRYNLHHL